MRESKFDVPVLLIFFARPNTFNSVFEKIREARPSILFLACDGPRTDKPEDISKINQCKEIALNIDWECKVYTKFSDANLGCGIGPFSAIEWAFQYVDRLMILEDDCVPDISLFNYMEVLLEKYKDDERIGVVSGYNHFQKWDCGGFDYCFTKTGATLGWGTWKRVWNKYDYYINDLDSLYYQRLLKAELYNHRAGEKRLAAWGMTRKRLSEGDNISWWDHQFGFLKYINSYLTIVPKENLIYNIGVGEGSTHAEHLKEKKWHVGDVCFMPTGTMPEIINHPKNVVCDRYYDEEYFQRIAYPNIFRKIFNKIRRKWG